MDQQRAGRAGFLVALAAALALVLTPLTGEVPASAAPITDFKPGNIISDQNFFNGSAMTASQVQSLLNQKVTGKIADPLRDYTEATPDRPSSTLCKGYTGSARNGKKETAAQIIARVGAACGISQKVLLVTLQKENSLVTKGDPESWRYRTAMGFGCPDTAPCNSEYFGFFNQVYKAASQFQNYRKNPRSFRHQLGWNDVYYNEYDVKFPNGANKCGTLRVNILNRATAGLYNYTPYTPNKASLNAGFGLADDRCASYGNRNFFNYYKLWFGNPTAPPVHNTFQAYWAKHSAWLGEPTAAAKKLTTNGGGLIQSFSGGGVYLSDAAGAQVTGITKSSPIMTAFVKAGSLEGSWGWPLAPGVNQGSSGNNTMLFSNGTVVESKVQGVHLIPKPLVQGWLDAGGFNGRWGNPVGNSSVNNGYTYQPFSAKVTAVRTGSGAARTMPTETVTGWTQLGPKTLGLPTGTVKRITANGGGTEMAFEGGAVYASSAGSFGVSQTQILSAYRSAGGPAGSWGWPTSRQACTTDGKECSVAFSQGIAVWTQSRGAIFTPSDSKLSNGVRPGTGEKVVGGATQ